MDLASSKEFGVPIMYTSFMGADCGNLDVSLANLDVKGQLIQGSRICYILKTPAEIQRGKPDRLASRCKRRAAVTRILH